MTDEKINHPAHYGGADNTYEAIKVIEALGLGPGFNLGSCYKYLARAGKKPGEEAVTDLKKALWYLQRHIGNLEKTQVAEPTEFGSLQELVDTAAPIAVFGQPTVYHSGRVVLQGDDDCGGRVTVDELTAWRLRAATQTRVGLLESVVDGDGETLGKVRRGSARVVAAADEDLFQRCVWVVEDADAQSTPKRVPITELLVDPAE